MTHTPHDRLVRRAFADFDVVRAHLRAVLPPALLARLDLSQLRREADVHIDAGLRERLSDLLFSAPVTGAEDGARAYVLALFEHKSDPDRWLVYDLARSVVRILEKSRRDAPGRRDLPLVVPLVLYAGRRPFSSPRRLLDLCGDRSLTDLLSGGGLDLGYFLTDLSHVSDDAIRAAAGDAAMRSMVLMLLKHAYAEDFFERLASFSDVLGAVIQAPTGLDALRTVLPYVCSVRGEETEREISRVVLPVMQRIDQETVMTKFKSYADILREEGEKRGEERGEQRGETRGLAVGETRATARALLAVLRQRFEVSDEVAARVNAAPLAQLEQWFTRSLVADRMDDVFAS